MVIKLEQKPLIKDIEVTIKYPLKTKKIESIVSLLKSVEEKIECYFEDALKQISISDVFYIESMDKKTYAYCENNNYQTKLPLYQFNKKLENYDFVQISKYCIININKLDKIKPLFNRRMEATLMNGKRLYITRKYYAVIKQKLQENE